MMVRTRHWVRRWLAAAFAPWILLHPNSPGQARERGASSNGFSEMKPHLKRLAGVLVLAAIYFCAGKLGLLLAFFNASVSPVWPPTGIALAALLLWGYRLWPGIFLGAFLVNFTWSTSLRLELRWPILALPRATRWKPFGEPGW